MATTRTPDLATLAGRLERLAGHVAPEPLEALAEALDRLSRPDLPDDHRIRLVALVRAAILQLGAAHAYAMAELEDAAAHARLLATKSIV